MVFQEHENKTIIADIMFGFQLMTDFEKLLFLFFTKTPVDLVNADNKSLDKGKNR